MHGPWRPTSEMHRKVMLFGAQNATRQLKPCLNMQSDLICSKVFDSVNQLWHYLLC